MAETQNRSILGGKSPACSSPKGGGQFNLEKHLFSFRRRSCLSCQTKQRAPPLYEKVSQPNYLSPTWPPPTHTNISDWGESLLPFPREARLRARSCYWGSSTPPTHASPERLPEVPSMLFLPLSPPYMLSLLCDWV